MRVPIGVLGVVFGFVVSAPARAIDFIVNPGQSIQAAIDLAGSGDRVLVGPGTYFEAIDFKGKAIEVLGVAGAAATKLDLGGAFGTVVSFRNSEPAAATLEGVTLRAAAGTLVDLGLGVGTKRVGGGILVTGNSRPTVRDCIVELCSANRGAGCASLVPPGAPATLPRFDDCLYKDNFANELGGGVYGPMHLTDCRLESNVGSAGGGGAHGGVHVERCEFIGNHAGVTGFGGGFWATPDPVGAAPLIRECSFKNNIAANGGGLFASANTPTLALTGCRFEGNSANSAAAANLSNTWNQPPVTGSVSVESCLFVAIPGVPTNSLTIGGPQSSALVQGSTFVNGGGLWIGTPNAKVSSCIFSSVAPLTVAGAPIPAFDHCAHITLLPGTGNITADPQFVNAAGNDYRLSPSSPCIEAGSATYQLGPGQTAPSLDLEQRPRVQSYRIDMGAHEFETDCDGAGVADWVELASGAVTDCDGGGVPDSCEFHPDCNGNGIPDACDILGGAASDCNQDGVPDSCQSGEAWNFDSNGVVDTCQYRLVPQEFPTIQAAIDATDPSNVIVVGDGVFKGAGNVELDFHGKTLHVRSRHGSSRTTIDCGGTVAAVNILTTGSAGAVVEGFTIRGATGPFAIRIASTGSFAFRRCAIVDNSCSSSGVVACLAGTTTFEGCVVARNSSAISAGGIVASSGAAVQLRRCTVAFDTALGIGAQPGAAGGGGLWVTNGATIDATECVFAHNAAPLGASALVTGFGARLTVTRSLVAGGAASLVSQLGGAIVYDPSNTAADPQFVPVPAGDVHLTATSPCVGAGTLGGADFEGDPTAGTSDLGADEFHTRLYASGAFAPGGTLYVTAVGSPGAAPVLLLVGAFTLPFPIPTPYGPLLVGPPYLGSGPLPIAASLSATGFVTVSAVLPPSLPPGYPFRAQALLGGPVPVLTNLLALDS